MNKIELAWAAGFFDGEGCTYVTRQYDRPRSLRFCMSVTQVDREVLDRFQRALQLGSVRGPFKTDYASQRSIKPRWVWRATGNTARTAIDRLWPYLSTVKRDQALIAFERWEQS